MWELRAVIEAGLRWAHVFAAIVWIGQTYLFNSFERRMRASAAAGGPSRRLWMVHGGGFYVLDKQRVPEIMPHTLQWFKWAAASTWLTGAALLGTRYYLGGLMAAPNVPYAVSVAAGLASIVIGWIVYDVLVRSPVGRDDLVLAVIGLALILAVHVGLREVVGAAAAYIHVGAILATIMAANVWLRILPSHRKMVSLAQTGRASEFTPPESGASRSKHNSYLAVPVVFMMIGTHQPVLTYAAEYPNLTLAAVLVVGWLAARMLRGR